LIAAQEVPQGIHVLILIVNSSYTDIRHLRIIMVEFEFFRYFNN